MRYLLTNDDGIGAPGIRYLARELCRSNEVCVMAPDGERSASSHSMTITLPLIPQKTDYFEFMSSGVYRLNGTPVDCVKVALKSPVFGGSFDAVVSGINIGPNLGTDVLYSGTAAAAIEGVILGCRGAALSINSHSPRHLDEISALAAALVPKINFSALPENTALNINFPDCPVSEIAGLKVCALGVSRYTDELKIARHPRGFDYFWTSGSIDDAYDNSGTDMYYIARNYITLTPVAPDLTNFKGMDGAMEIAAGLKSALNQNS